MPMYLEDQGDPGPRMAVHGSIAVEIDWAMSGALCIKRRPLQPALEQLYRADPRLGQEVSELWSEEESLSYPGFLELSVLAHHGGLLFSLDSEAFLGALERLCSDAPRDLTLASESPTDRERLLLRLSVLRRSAKRRSHYVDVVTRVWTALREGWESEGRPAVEKAIADRRARAARGQSWQEFATNECRSDSVGGLVEALEPDGELAVVPAYFTQTGLIVDLPGVVVVGVRTGESQLDTRVRTEHLARRLKAIADPTRLSILALLGRDEMTVTGIAQRFDLAQPTVSNHVKLLRDAGLVSMRSDGRSRHLILVPDAVDALGHDLEELLGIPSDQA